MDERASVLSAALLGLTLWVVPAAVGWGESPPAEAAAAQTGAGAASIGIETCAACHTDTVAAFRGTPHAASAAGCEGCHGNAQAHVAGEGDKAKIVILKNLSAKEASRVCLTCHDKAGQKHWLGSAHDSRQVSCITCHNPHPPAGQVPAGLLRKPQFELCTGCHLQKKAALLRSGHMPMREGKMNCTSCHNPHGTPYDRQLLQTSINQNCYSCHAEKRGPYLWEHPPVRENCLNCHDAHGTIQDKLLKVKPPLLCQQCHQTASHPGPAYPAMSRYAFNQGCLHCHPMIHGSTHPSGNRFFR